jgi:N-acetylglucosamine-6-sulfatase
MAKLYAIPLIVLLLIGSVGTFAQAAHKELDFERIPGTTPKNVIFILTDDHRFDFMGFTGKVPWLETPNMDRLAREGAYFPNTFVTTSLCSPSRASILTGQFSHTHTVVDNSAPAPESLVYFPEYLQKAGYETSFFGKWHMGSSDDNPRPGFDHWESFRGQGVYYNPTLNIDGEQIRYGDSAYITDLLTEHALTWLEDRDKEKPFFMYLSHKAVHAEFAPARRHLAKYENEEILLPPSFYTSAQPVKGKSNPFGPDEYPSTVEREAVTMAGYPEGFLENRRTNAGAFVEPATNEDYYGVDRMPDWQKMQRESWHGVDYMYHGSMDFATFYKRYCETLLAVDESVGVLLDYLDREGLAESTVVIYMGDNGFSFGEHGLIDKRQFYEESAKVPFLVRYPGILEGNQVIDKMVQNIDVAPTILELAGVKEPPQMQGHSIVPILKGEDIQWRDRIFYEYYWENSFPQTPTMHGVRTERYKLIRYHGIWDTNEFYDLQEDPYEMHNLIKSHEHRELINQLTDEIYDWLESTGGMQIPLKRSGDRYGDHRNQGGYN